MKYLESELLARARRRLRGLAAPLALLASLSYANTAVGADVEIYEHGSCLKVEEMRFIFIVDNSGSMDATEFSNSKSTIDAAIGHVLDSELPGIQVAVLQYGSTNDGSEHSYDITVPFTNDKATATNWGRVFANSSTAYSDWHQDHQPASLAKMRVDNIYAEGGALDVSDATNVQFVFFTDAPRDVSSTVCCSSIVAGHRQQIPSYVKDGFGEYDVLKDGSLLPNGIKAQFTLLHSAPDADSQAAGAAIASVGGEYTGAVESNAADPDGSGVSPRRYILGDLTASDTTKIVELLDQVFEEINITTTLAAPAIAASQANATRHSDRLYYSLFNPGKKRNWFGNVKAYRVNEEGFLVDSRGDLAINVDTGGFGETTRSFWSEEDDGADVRLGGYASQLTTNRPWYTDVGGVLQRVQTTDDIPASALGGGVSDADRDKAVDWALGVDTVDFDADEDTVETANFVGDVLHSAPLLAQYAINGAGTGREVLYATSNLGRLHAIDPINGHELWSYTPEELLPNLLEATDERSDINDHQYGLDGPMAFYAHRSTRSAGSTVLDEGYLYLTQRRGGSGIIALDVSDALSSSVPFNVAWKVDANTPGFRDLGQSWGKPQIAAAEINCGTVSGCEQKTVLVLSGGYNDAYDDENYASVGPSTRVGHGNAIYLVDPLTGERLWSAGESSAHDLKLDMDASIAVEPVIVDTDGDGAIEVIFALDVTGKVWRIDLDPTAASMSELHRSGGLIADMSGVEGGKLRFYNKLDVSIQNSGSGAARFDLAFGSGSRANPLADEVGRNAFYIVRDPWVHRSPVAWNSSTGEFEPEYRYVQSAGTRSVITPAVLAAIGSTEARTALYGYTQQLEGAEKVLSPSLTYGGKTFVVTYLPPEESRSDLGCAYSLGSSRVRVYNTKTKSFDTIPSNGEEVLDVAPGIIAQITLLDTGTTDGVQVVAGTNMFDLDDIAQVDLSNMRRIVRTSWQELSD